MSATGDQVHECLARLEQELADQGIRVRVDRRTNLGLGRRITDWELKGVPVRIEVGPRDLADGRVSVIPRAGSERAEVPIPAAVSAALDALRSVKASLFAQALEHRACHLVDTADVSTAIEAAQVGFVRVPWEICRGDGERILNDAGVSIRCVTTADGAIPETLDDDQLVAIAARAY